MDNGLPDDMKGHHDLADILEKIAKVYDGLFENGDTYFGYHGFESGFQKREFLAFIEQAVMLLRQYAKNTYNIQMDVNVADL